MLASLLSESYISLGKNGPSCFLPLKHTVAQKSIQEAEAGSKVEDQTEACHKNQSSEAFLHVVTLYR